MLPFGIYSHSVLLYLVFFPVGDGACCARAEVQGLGYEGGERATVG